MEPYDRKPEDFVAQRENLEDREIKLRDQYFNIVDKLDRCEFGTNESSKLIADFEEVIKKMNEYNEGILEFLKRFNIECHMRGRTEKINYGGRSDNPEQG